MPDTIRAAGGVVLRSEHGVAHVLVVHRPRYDDWSLPKGKLGPGERHRDAARREVIEETGLSCSLADELSPVEYLDHQGRPKRVRYWVMTVESGAFQPNEEVDRIAWVPAADAIQHLSHPQDADVVAEAVSRSVAT